MVSAWFMDDSSDDQRLQHHRSPPKYVSLEDLKRRTGVEYYKVDPVQYENDVILKTLRSERKYSYEDEKTLTKDMKDYDEVLRFFYAEHLHTDEEIRFVLDGSGYFDVRDDNDEWIRILVEAGDLLVVPAGIYHRFTLDDKNYIRAKRYFIGEPVWTPYNRPADQMDCRQEYLKQRETGAFNKM